MQNRMVIHVSDLQVLKQKEEHQRALLAAEKMELSSRASDGTDRESAVEEPVDAGAAASIVLSMKMQFEEMLRLNPECATALLQQLENIRLQKLNEVHAHS